MLQGTQGQQRCWASGIRNYSALKNMAELAVCLSGASLRIVCVILLSPLDLFPSLRTEWGRVVRKQFWADSLKENFLGENQFDLVWDEWSLWFGQRARSPGSFSTSRQGIHFQKRGIMSWKDTHKSFCCNFLQILTVVVASCKLPAFYLFSSLRVVPTILVRTDIKPLVTCYPGNSWLGQGLRSDTLQATHRFSVWTSEMGCKSWVSYSWILYL